VTCRHCEDVIGAYEPMVVLADGRARMTCKAAEPDLAPDVEECYHHACYMAARGQGLDLD
jgi:hypothetical protein